MEPLLGATRVSRILGVEVETLGAWRKKGYGPRWYRIGKKIEDVNTYRVGHPLAQRVLDLGASILGVGTVTQRA